MADRPVWQTRVFARQISDDDDDASSVSTRSTQSASTAAHGDPSKPSAPSTSETADQQQQQQLENQRQHLKSQGLQGIPTQNLSDPTRPADDRQEGIVSPRVPCEENFIGLFIKLCLWEPAWRQAGLRERWASHRYRTRLGMQIDAAKIGEGASFIVTKRHEFVRPGSGGGKAKLVVMKDTKLKFDRAGKPSDPSVLAAILSEVEILSHKPLFDHPNIITLLDVRWDHPSMYKEPLGPTLYLEYANMGTLASYFRWYPAECAGESVVVTRLLLDVCRGLQALHACGITHGDVKPNNVLVFRETDSEGAVTAKISDFGCSVIRRHGSDDSDSADMVELSGFSPPWDAPEAAGGRMRAALLHKTDIYSFGLVYWWARRGGKFPLLASPTESEDTESPAVENLRQKKAEDLGPMMHESLIASPHPTGGAAAAPNEFEVTLVASATLTVDPEQRDLDVVAEALQQSIASEAPDAPSPAEHNHDAFTKIHEPSWSSEKAWDVYLETADSWHTTSKRFVDAMRVQVEGSKLLPPDQRQALHVLLMRCYLEGFGVDANAELAAYHLRRAALAGDRNARGLAQAFHEILGVRLPSDLPIMNWLVAATQVNFLDASRKLAQLDYVLYRQAVPSVQHADLHDPRFDTEQDFMAQLLIWTPSRAVLEVLGPSALSPVHFAAARGWTDALGFLLDPLDHYECRRYLNTTTASGHTPLLMALVFRQPDAAVRLLSLGEEAAVSESALLSGCFDFGPLPPGALFGMLPGLPLDGTGDIACVDGLCQMLSATGANPNWPSPDGVGLADLLESQPAFNEWVGQKLATVVELAVYYADHGYLRSVLDAGAQPTRLALHLAAGLHDVDAFRLMFSHPNCPFQSLSELDVGGDHILDTVLDCNGSKALFSPLKRLFVSRKSPADACRDMVQFLSTVSGFSLYHTSNSPPPEEDPWWLSITKRTYASHPSVLDVLLGPNRRLLNTSLDPSKHAPPIMWTLVIGNDRLSLHLLSLGAEPIKDGPDNSLNGYLGFMSPDNDSVVKGLLEAGCDPNATLTATSLALDDSRRPQTPFQSAVLLQHFRSASCLYEHGANRDYVTRSLGASKDLTMLGHLLYITWSESQNRIRYLFEAYPRAPPPEFIVMPYVGLSALQIAAQLAPQTRHGEADARDLMAYLVSRYPGARFLEYQRFDSSTDRPDAGKDYPGSASAAVTGSGSDQASLSFAYLPSSQTASGGVNTAFSRDFKSSPLRLPNGTALLMAAREANLEAVKVLVEAGADVSAPLGYRKVSALAKETTSSYATKELLFASNPLDFAVLARDKMHEDPPTYPLSLWQDTPETRAYYRDRIDEVIAYLGARGAKCSTAFVGRRNTALLWKTRREQGNREALRFFGSTFRTAWEVGKGAFRHEFRGGMAQFREDQKREEERLRQRREAGLDES
ncbi:hypothetical protein B0T19DRAFT_268611 [Cercophora scortea]|uniref:Protein kinase domain-containing protein n=1 Tax=Cercophora scortea TaxID=314031 RepID=A0AAE0I6G5_9PEZI|nr:hypothetical protein B0T19DRAFT_268611 [Cercophora scortea]